MKINWKVRLKNKVFISAMISAIFMILTNIPSIAVVLPEFVNESVFQGGLQILTLLGVISDGTTYGMWDSDRAMTYETDHDERLQK